MKTRAWDGKQWRTDYVVMPDGSLWRYEFSVFSGNRLVENVDWKLSRFTGHMDNSTPPKEIYEGDIREGEFYDSISAGGKKYIVHQVMKWDERNMCFEWFGPFMPDFCGTVIVGNIFMNPELEGGDNE